MSYDICAPLKRTAVNGCCECVIDDERHTVCVSCLCKSFDIKHVECRVCDSLTENETGALVKEGMDLVFYAK